MKKIILIIIVLILLIPSLLFKESGIVGVVTDAWIDEQMIITQLVYLENKETVVIVGKGLDIGEQYYFKHPDMDLRELLKNNKMETLQLLLQSSDLEIKVFKRQRLQLKDIKEEFLTMDYNDNIITKCDYNSYRKSLEEDYYFCNFNESDYVGHSIVSQNCIDMIEYWKKKKPEIIFGIPKNEWLSIKSRTDRVESIMESYSDHCSKEMIPLKGHQFMLFDMVNNMSEEDDDGYDFNIYYFVKE